MTIDIGQICDLFKGKFLADPVLLRQKLFNTKAYIFDWDGVFNNGIKDENGSSAFSEVDAMGTNLLRFNHYLRTGNMPVVAIISGEQNKAAFTLAKREHFNSVYYKFRNKTEALQHLCKNNDLEPGEVAFVFDDVLDFSIAEKCGLRIMVSRICNPLLLDFVEQYQLADYITFADGGNHAVRESVELLTALSEQYAKTIEERMHYSDHYQRYLQIRNLPQPFFYTTVEPGIIEQMPL